MYELKTRQESGSLFRDPLRIEAVVQMAACAPTELFTIAHDGALVAAVLTFIDGDICRFYGTYYDDRWAKFSPGVSLLYGVVQSAQARGRDFDFMTGEQEYKMRFASEVVPLYIAHVSAANLRELRSRNAGTEPIRLRSGQVRVHTCIARVA